MQRVIGGLWMEEPGWRKIRIRPIPGGDVCSAKVKYLSAYGVIDLEWHIDNPADDMNKPFNLRVSIPPNSTARIEFPQDCHATVTIGSGVYQYQSSYIPPEWPPLPHYAPFSPHDDYIP